MKKTTSIIILLCSICFLSCSNPTHSDDQITPTENNKDQNYQEGSICVIDNGDGSYGVVKVLVIEEEGVHVKIFANSFKTQPSQINLDSLHMGSIESGEFGIGHVPLATEGFDNWHPETVGYEKVSESELEGYYFWKNQ